MEPSFIVLFVQVKVSTVNGSQLVEPLDEWSTYDRPDDAKKPMVEFELKDLKEMTSYEVEIRSRNDVGWSPTNERFIFTTSQGLSLTYLGLLIHLHAYQLYMRSVLKYSCRRGG